MNDNFIVGEQVDMSDDVILIHFEKLLWLTKQRGLLQPLDVIVARNALLDLFRLERALAADAREALWRLWEQGVQNDERTKRSLQVEQSEREELGEQVEREKGEYAEQVEHEQGVRNELGMHDKVVDEVDDIDVTVQVLIDAAVERDLLEADTLVQRDLFDARMMGLLLPSASEVAARFWRIVDEGDRRAATDYFYKLCVNGRYIRMDRIRLNKHWLVETRYGALEVTINLSKPEKDPRDIAAERQMAVERRPSDESYPQCVLCIENMGYAGRIDHPARQNHRLIPLRLVEETWYMQYSPYVYYNEHAIILNEKHTPMKMNKQTFAKLLDFVEQFPHYFVGSNADLPIVGGSILNHDHFQAGRHVFAMERAAVEKQFRHERYPQVEAQILAWPMSVVRLVSTDKAKLLAAAGAVLAAWREYSDEAVDIVAYSDGLDDAAGERVPHNTITPIARINGDGAFELDLVLRNNRTTSEHPYGLFHPHEPLHHIKKENIGLIEVMGLAILPGRLLEEIDAIINILTGVELPEAEMHEDEEHMLHKHVAWLDELVAEHGTGLEISEAKQVMERAVGEKFVKVLEDAGVFRRTDAGQAAFSRFMDALGFERVS